MMILSVLILFQTSNLIIILLKLKVFQIINEYYRDMEKESTIAIFIDFGLEIDVVEVDLI